MVWDKLKSIWQQLSRGGSASPSWSSSGDFNSSDHYVFDSFRGLTRCYVCQAPVRNETAVGPTAKGWFDHTVCHICRTPVCEKCAEVFWRDEWDGDIGYRYKLCARCRQNHAEITDTNSLLKMKPEGQGCYVCLRRSLDSAELKGPNPLGVRRCMRCGIPGCEACLSQLETQLLCAGCRDIVAADRFTCFVCHQSFFREQVSLINCAVCNKEFCSAHRVSRRVDGKIRNVCPGCACQTSPIK